MSWINLINKKNLLFAYFYLAFNWCLRFDDVNRDGDFYAALRDCSMALRLMAAREENSTPAILTSKLLGVRCLLFLGWVKAAKSILEEIRTSDCLPGPSCPPEPTFLTITRKKNSVKDIGRIVDQLTEETRKLEELCFKSKSPEVDTLLPGCGESGDVSHHSSPARGKFLQKLHHILSLFPLFSVAAISCSNRSAARKLTLNIGTDIYWTRQHLVEINSFTFEIWLYPVACVLYFFS